MEGERDAVLMMGMFNTIMMYMHILSKWFSDAGLRDVLIQSGTIAERSIDKALSGKMYNRGIREYKLMYEAIMRKVVLDHVETGEDIYYQANWLDDLDLETFWQESCLQEKYNQFLDSRKKLNNGEPLQKFWMSFLEMVKLFLSTIYSTRHADWELLLECIRRILPYTFAFDHINYARYFSVMLGDMLQLPNDFPDVYEEFMGGKFAAQLTENSKFSRIKTDKVMEMTLNKGTKTPGNHYVFNKE